MKTKIITKFAKLFLTATLLALTISVTTTFAADRYWVSGENTSCDEVGEYTFNNTNCWATGAGGSGGASVPGSGDRARFNPASGYGDSDVTVPDSKVLRGLNLEGTYSGTVTGGNNMEIGTYGFIQSTGEFKQSSGNTNITYSFTISGGTWTHNNGTLVFMDTYNTNLNINSSIELYNLTINKTGNSSNDNLNISNEDTLNVNNLLTLTDGETTNGTIVVKDPASVTWNSGFSGGGTTIRLDTSTNFSIDANSTLSTLTLNNDSLVVDTEGTLTTSRAFRIQGGEFRNDGADDILGNSDDPNITFSNTFYSSGVNSKFDAGDATKIEHSQRVDIDGSSTYDGNLADELEFNEDLDINGGTLDATDVDYFDMNDIFNLDSGEIKLPSDTASFEQHFRAEDGGTITHNNGTVYFDGLFQGPIYMNSLNQSFNNVVINKTGTTPNDSCNPNTDLDIDGNLTLTDGDIHWSSHTIKLGGDWSIGASADFAAELSTLELDGSGQTIYGDNSGTFYNLIKQVTSPDTIYFEGGQETRVTNNLTLTGVSGNLLDIRSTNATPAKLNATNSMTVDFVRIQDVNNIRASGDYDLRQSAKGHTENTDLGAANTGWLFDNPYVAPIPEFSTWLLILTMLIGTGLVIQKNPQIIQINK